MYVGEYGGSGVIAVIAVQPVRVEYNGIYQVHGIVGRYVLYCVMIVIAAGIAAFTFFMPNRKKQ